jgi:hypothetical protein
MPPTSDENLVPCPHCKQHHRSSDSACPHCGEDLPLTIDPVDDPDFRDVLSVRMMYGPPGYQDPDQGTDDLEGKEQDGRIS